MKETENDLCTISELLCMAEDHIPAIAWIILWLAVCPVRWVALLLLPVGAQYRLHKLHKVREFFAFREY